jgi:hypothetical protein
MHTHASRAAAELEGSAHPESSPRTRRFEGSPRVLRAVYAGRSAITALRLLACSFVIGSSLTPAPSSAQEPPSAESPAPEEPGDNEVLTLVITGDVLSLGPDRLREAIAGELHRVVTLGAIAPAGRSALLLRVETGRRVVLTYRAPDGRVTERAIDLPADPDRAVETVALLAGNLARDEAAELRAALSKRPEAGEPRVAPQAPAPPPPVAVAKGAPRIPPARATSAPGDDFACRSDGAKRTPLSVDFVPFVGSSTMTGGNTVRRFAFNALGGYGAGIHGVGIGGLVNVESEFVCGLQLAGLVNAGPGPLRGVQLSGIGSFSGPVSGVQISGIVNVSRGLEGVQAALVNVDAGPVLGVQMGLIDIAASDVRGAQLGWVGIAAGDVRGAQIGLVEIATGNVGGAQIGLVNVAGGEVHGAQIGLVNTAETSDFSLGLLNIIRKGRLHADLWGNESGLITAGVKHGGDSFHNIYGIGVQVGVGDPRWSWSLGIGGHLPISDRFFVDLDVLGHAIHEINGAALEATIVQVRALLGVQLDPRLGIYAGPSFNVGFAESEDIKISPVGGSLFLQSDEVVVRGWPGVVVGLQVL